MTVAGSHCRWEIAMQVHQATDAHSNSNDPTPSPGTITVLAGRVFDPYTRAFLCAQAITVDPRTGLICDVRAQTQHERESAFDSDVQVVDLRDATVLPGFVDAHVHLFLHPYAETSWEDQLTKEPLVERTVRAVNHARETLLAGDLGTEGAGDADVALRKCLSGVHALVPGPRYYIANRALVPTGSYGPKGNLRVNEEGVQGISGAEVADGVEECRKAVRRQIGAGADWIKVRALLLLVLVVAYAK
ncbi:hypothetical protein EW145_g8195 [Phellinidium pouzarii]|uniref:Amidohydrolase-related domain-containing protein n=1 Tax=Phellinidium pouzarii TaxID=167371 RepID=A0A4S4K8N7_9AGAM|nr:hypothetical protein EW145_g8195 [Phellinidium pouzarii]